MCSYREKKGNNGVLGMHLEGPFLNEKRRGAHLPQFLQKPTDTLIDQIIDLGKDQILILTIAPELFEERTIDRLLASGINLSVGHSDATYEQAQRAFAQGIRLCTHLFNAMSPFQHREPGVVGAVFDTPQSCVPLDAAKGSIFAPIILDGFHCDYAAARVAYKILGERLFLVSDALFLGQKVKKFSWENFDITLKNGQYRNAEGNLAGAAISMIDAVRNAVQFVGIPLEEAINMATISPAKAVGLDHKIGRIAPHFPANLVVFDDALDGITPLSI